MAPTPTILYTACLLGAVALYMLIRGGGDGAAGRGLRALGAVLGVGVFGYMTLAMSRLFAVPGEPLVQPNAFFLLFSLIAIGCAVAMITNPRPVYSALFFVLVVLASAGLFLLLQAEFMAFALIIVYAGAILITYMFVLMLAQQAPDESHDVEQPEYDRKPREPLAGAIVGFILLALLSRMLFDGAGDGTPPITPRATVAEARQEAWDDLTRLPQRLADASDLPLEAVLEVGPGDLVDLGPGKGAVLTLGAPDAADAAEITLPESAIPENVQRVGIGLVKRFPVSLELAGVILLMAMFGAVILARRQIELTEDEKRAAAGMRRLGHHDEGPPPAGGGT